ncbi:MAG TPA: M20/M25/M40 family metallo-hydrolase [Gaiellaceae bacterium]|nr:M20/M25/M40 family metallo-hydrolase [Gaiellaceae bacterium]
MTLRDEVTQLLQELIRLDTVNPPGNETRAAEHLRGYLERNGVACELHARVPERANLVARLPGSGDGPSLCLVSHTDTVLADPAEWQRDPWSGDLAGGEVWGRGALDMKGQVAASAVAIASLAREGFRPSGDLLFVAAADEEVGDGFGLEWLCAEHPDAVRCDLAVNEGAGDRLELGGRVVYLCAAAEKMSAPFRLRVRGRSGHASQPGIADNALVKAARLVERLGSYRPEPRLQPETEAFLRVVGAEIADAEHALDAARRVSPAAAELVEPLLGPTLAPTMIAASEKRNVIPGICDVVVDCRLPPGESPATFEPTIRALLGDTELELELEWLEAMGGTRSSFETSLWRAIEEFVAAEEPGARLAPIVCPGFTDSHWLREAFGTVAYGFFPARAMEQELAARLIHSADERVPVDDLELGVRFLRAVARTVSG